MRERYVAPGVCTATQLAELLCERSAVPSNSHYYPRYSVSGFQPELFTRPRRKIELAYEILRQMPK